MGHANRVLAIVLGGTLLCSGANAADNSGGNHNKAITLNVAVLAPTSGVAAAGGDDMNKGWNLWFKQHGDKYGSVKIVSKTYDTASSPNTALTKARQAVQQDKARILVGTLLASGGAAVAPFAEQNKIPFLVPVASTDDLSQRQANRYIIKAGGWSSSQPAHVAGQWAYDQGYRKIVTLAPAYSFGYENSGGFAQVFHDAGGQIVDQLFPPLGTKDFSPYIAKIKQEKPDAVFSVLVGADGPIFLKQWSLFGLKKTIPLINNVTTTDQSNMRQGDPSIFEGLITIGQWADGRDDKSTQDFVAAFEKAYGQMPDSHAASMYVAARWLTVAVRQAKDDSDLESLVDALRAVKLDDSALGPISLDKYGGAVFNVYLMKVVPVPPAHRKYGQLWNVVEKTWPNVSQFWTYNPETYLKQPVYSNTFQGR